MWAHMAQVQIHPRHNSIDFSGVTLRMDMAHQSLIMWHGYTLRTCSLMSPLEILPMAPETYLSGKFSQSCYWKFCSPVVCE